MTFTRLTNDLAIIAALADQPNATSGLTAAQLKAKFDEASGLIKAYLNNTLSPEIETALGGITPSPQSLDRQALIDGNLDVWQRGTSFAATGSVLYTADRWCTSNNITNQASTISRQDGTGVPGSNYCLRYQRNVGQTGINGMQLVQNLVTIDSKKLIGKKLTLSFWARIGSGASFSLLNAAIFSGTGTDQNVISGFTGGLGEISTNLTLSTTWQNFSVTTTNVIASSKSQLAVSFLATPTGTAGANDYFEIAQVQVNAGVQALPFQARSYADELISCQRYGEIFGAVNFGRWLSAANARLAGTFKVTKRVTPTLTLLSTSVTIEEVNVANRTTAAATIVTPGPQTNGYFIDLGGFIGATAGNSAESNTDFGFADAEL